MSYIQKPTAHHPALPKNKLGRARMEKLHIYAGPEHPHVAQQPQPLV